MRCRASLLDTSRRIDRRLSGSQSDHPAFDVENTGPGPEILTITVEFVERMPVGGTVLVSIGDGAPVEYTVGG